MAEPQQRVSWWYLTFDFFGSQPHISVQESFPPRQLISGTSDQFSGQEVPYAQQCTLQGVQRERVPSFPLQTEAGRGKM